MYKKIKIRNTMAMAIAIISVGTTALFSQDAQNYSPKVNEIHTDFVLPSIEDGKPIRLSSFRGKKLLLIHFASW